MPNIPTYHSALFPMAWLVILLLNAQNVNAHIIQIRAAVQDLGTKPKVIAVTETHHRPNSLNNKPFLYGYRWLGKPSSNPSRGTGFWIEKDVARMCDPVPLDVLNEQHPDIFWIHFTAQKTNIYIAVVYSHPSDVNNHSRILNTLDKNIVQLSKIGKIIIMGDFNARCPELTGDKTTNSHSPKMMSFVENNEMAVLKNEIQQNSGEHFSFQGPMGESIPDYILVPKLQLGPYTYKVNNVLHTGSYHRMIEAKFPFPTISVEDWGMAVPQRVIWDKTNTEVYFQSLKNNLSLINPQKSPPTAHHITKHANDLVKSITNATEKISTSSHVNKKRKRAGQGQKPNTTMSKLIQKKSEILNGTRKGTKEVRKNGWKMAHVIQNEIAKAAIKDKEKADDIWWHDLANMNNSESTRLMWKQLKKARKTVSTPFPGRVIGKDGKIVQGTAKVLEAVKSFYEDISKNEDETAQNYNKPRMFGPAPPIGKLNNHTRNIFNVRTKRVEEQGIKPQYATTHSR